MPPPLSAVAAFAALSDHALSQKVDEGGVIRTVQFALYDLLRQEQSLVVAAGSVDRSELSRILDLAQMAYGDLAGLLAGRDDALLDAHETANGRCATCYATR